jgi:hypothetical protein
MNKEKVIEAAHSGQHDAGSLEWFKSKMKQQSETDSLPDPVVVALSHAIRSNTDEEGAASTLEFYAKEMQRAANAVKGLG